MKAEPGAFLTKSEYVYERLRADIISLTIEPGAVLNQATLAKSVGTSTTPLREALRRLSAEGLIELDAHRDARVTDLSAGEVGNLIEVRSVLEPLAASLAAQRRSDEDLDRIRFEQEAMQQWSLPGGEHLGAHRRFHLAIFRASHNEILAEELHRLWDKSERYRHLGLVDARTTQEWDARNREHGTLVELIAKRDPEGAAAVMGHHVASSLAAIAARRLAAEATGPSTVSGLRRAPR